MKIKLPYLKAYNSDGKTYYYVRQKGHPDVRIVAPLGSTEFMEAYQAALRSAPPKTGRHGAGTFGALVTSFYGSVEFANLKPNSKRTYRLILDSVAASHGHRPAATMPASVASKLIETIGATRPSMANLTKKVMHRLMRYAVRTKVRADNPFAELTAYKQGTRHTWTEAELAAYEARWPLGTRERLAYALLLYTGQRGGDVARMRRQHIINGSIHVTQEKTGTELVLPIHAELRAALKAGPSDGLSLIGDKSGRPIQRAALTEFVKRAAKAAGLPSRCLPHGLRKAILRRLAESGGTAKEIAGVSGHKTLEEIELYTAAADQQKLAAAAMNKLEK